jgi:hypothetical protein
MMAIEFAPDVTVNAVAPGLILPPAGKDESYLQQLAQSIPLKRHGGPEDVAAAVLYLLKNDYLTGQVIFVDGGRSLREVESAISSRQPSPQRGEGETEFPSPLNVTGEVSPKIGEETKRSPLP